MTDVFDAPDVLLYEHRGAFSVRHRYEIVLPDGTPAAAVEETLGAGGAFFGRVVSSRYLVQDASGVLLAIERPGGLGKSEFFATWADGRGGKRLLLEDFYRDARLRHGVLLDGSDPEGGRWNFDHENREPPPKGRATLGVDEPPE